jgi:hypothetical protein
VGKEKWGYPSLQGQEVLTKEHRDLGGLVPTMVPGTTVNDNELYMSKLLKEPILNVLTMKKC